MLKEERSGCNAFWAIEIPLPPLGLEQFRRGLTPIISMQLVCQLMFRIYKNKEFLRDFLSWGLNCWSKGHEICNFSRLRLPYSLSPDPWICVRCRSLARCKYATSLFLRCSGIEKKFIKHQMSLCYIIHITRTLSWPHRLWISWVW